MEKYKNYDVEDICRTCLEIFTETQTKYNVFDTPDLLKKLTVCTSLTVEVNDVFPKNICELCFQKLNESHQFQKLCIDSVQKFQEILVSKQSIEVRRDFEEIHFDEKGKLEDATNSEPNSNEEFSFCDTKMKDQICVSKKVKRKSACSEKFTNRFKTRRKKQKSIKSESDTESVSENSTVDGNDFIENCKSSNDDGDNEGKDATFTPSIRDESINKKRQKSVDEINMSKESKQRKRRKNDAKDSKALKDAFVYKCNKCPKRFFVEHRLVAHKRTHEGLMPYPCTFPNCEKSFNRYHCLSEHIKQHEGTNRWYTCEEEGCGKVYKHKPTLAMHLRKFHKLGPELKSHICEICGKVFKAMRILQAHKFIHKDKSEFPFVCPEEGCDRRFAGREKLKIHLMRHAGIKNYVCSYCGMRKTTRNELKIHINYHTLERTWPCRFCAHVCNSAGNLKMHVRTVHERAKDYACRFCEKTFAKPDTRKYHEMTHTGEKPNECEQCGKRFIQPAALRTHRKIHLKRKLKAEASETSGTSVSKGVSTSATAPVTTIGLKPLVELEIKPDANSL